MIFCFRAGFAKSSCCWGHVGFSFERFLALCRGGGCLRDGHRSRGGLLRRFWARPVVQDSSGV